MAPPPPHVPSAAEPRRKTFDPWNSSSTGHQRAESRLAGSTSWRASRTSKLASQFKAGASGGKRLYDSVGAGSENFGKDGRNENGGWQKGAVGLREKGWQDIKGLLEGNNNKENSRSGEGAEREGKRRKLSDEGTPTGNLSSKESKRMTDATEAQSASTPLPPPPPPQLKKIFDGLCVFLNGSTAPLVGDHRLKQLLAENGARVSIALGRRSVTHVILGTPNGGGSAGGKKGAGGGLAATKIQKEIMRIGGKGVKVLESLKAGKRLPETQFSNISLAAKGQKSVYGMFPKAQSSGNIQETSDAGKFKTAAA
ncbi:MAG: hypothetical protein Q9172_003486 [Xanthocarpia lactea]